jgi:hypothetical protein
MFVSRCRTTLLVSLTPCLLVFAAAGARAQSTQPAPQPAAETAALLAPFLDQSTFLAGHADLARLDVPAAIGFLEQELAAAHLPKLARPVRNIAAARKAAEALLAQFQSLGGRHIYVLMDQVSAVPDPESFAFLVPVDKNAHHAGLLELLHSVAPPNAKVAALHHDLLFVGTEKTFNRLSRIAPAARPDLLAAFTPTLHHDPAPCTIAFAVGGDFRRMLLDSPVALPAELGGTPIATLVSPLRAAGLSLQTRPAPSLALVLATDDPNNASHLASVLSADLTTFVKAITAEAERSAETRAVLPIIQELPRLLAPTVEGSAVRINLDKSALSRLTALMVPSLIRAEEVAQRVASMSNMRQITVAALMYEQEHGTWPDSLAALDLPEALTTSPRELQNRAYTYHPWSAEQIEAIGGGDVPVLWEQPDGPDEPVSVAFADGHVEMYSAQSALDALLAKAQDKLDKAASGETPPAVQEMPEDTGEMEGMPDDTPDDQ